MEGYDDLRAKRRSASMWLDPDKESQGGILLSVHSDNSDWTKKATEILRRSGAEDVSSTGEAGASIPDSPTAAAARATRYWSSACARNLVATARIRALSK